MAKRFIDTGLFDDPWFMELGKDAKLLWVYLITKCDHAGIIDINRKLTEFQTGIKSYETVSKQLKERLFHIRDNYYFIPKYIDFQYPDFPRSNVRQQQSAIKILISFGLFDEQNQTLIKDLAKYYVNDTVIDNDTDNATIKRLDFEIFWDSYHSITGKPKTDKEATIKYWNKLTDTEQQKAIDKIQDYYDSLDNKKYSLKARSYLAGKNFNDEFTKQESITDPFEEAKRRIKAGELEDGK